MGTLTIFRDEDGVEYHGKGEEPEEVVKQMPGDYTTYYKSPFDGKYRNNWNDEVLEKKD